MWSLRNDCVERRWFHRSFALNPKVIITGIHCPRAEIAEARWPTGVCSVRFGSEGAQTAVGVRGAGECGRSLAGNYSKNA